MRDPKRQTGLVEIIDVEIAESVVHLEGAEIARVSEFGDRSLVRRFALKSA